ncbi:MAG TPA: TraU family protein [Cellvibrio sp.]
MLKYVFVVFLYLSIVSSATHAQSVPTGEKEGNLSTLDIIESAISCVDCLEWELLGICFWLRCSLFSCDIETSWRVGHYIPELVIASYTFQSEWDATTDWNNNPSGAITRSESSKDQDTNLDFKSVDVISHPATWIFDALGSSEFFCESANDIPMLPHFLSSFDPNWNDPGIEQIFPQSIFGTPKITTGNWLPILGDGYWAPLYPRCGWGAHPYDAINAAVAAHRAAEIVTRDLQPHVYLPANGSCENRCWRPDPVSIGGNDNRFQQVAPWVENSHMTFGGPASWANGRRKNRESYMWNLWRYYACCEREGAYITRIDF